MVEPRKSIIDEKNVRPFVSPQQKKQRRITVVIVLVVVAIAAGAYVLLSPREDIYALRNFERATVYAGSMEQTTQASGTIVIPTQIEVRSPEAGYARSIFVSEGDTVQTGDVLAEIAVPDLEESLSDLRADYETDLLTHEKSMIQNEISIQKSSRAIRDLEDEVEDARIDLEKTRRLFEANASSRSELDTAENLHSDLIEQLEEARSDLEDDRRIIDIDTRIQNASLVRTRTEIARLEKRIDDSKITSPMSGEILEIDESITVPGTEISANQSIFVIADPGSATADLEILEQYSSAVAIGDEVELTVSNTKMIGIVQQVGRVAQTSSSGLGATIAVRVKPVDPPISLLSGATAVGTFVLGVEEDALMLPRGPYLTTGSQRYVYVIEGATALRRAVTFGEIEGNVIEVISGLEVGDEIIFSGYQNFIEYQTLRIEQGE